MSDHSWLEQTAPYALGALDEEERASFEAHLATCDVCASEVRELREVADLVYAPWVDEESPPVPPGLSPRAGGRRSGRGRRLAGLALKELRETLRDRRTIGTLLFGFPRPLDEREA